MRLLFGQENRLGARRPTSHRMVSAQAISGTPETEVIIPEPGKGVVV
jgi:hypothetical protein